MRSHGQLKLTRLAIVESCKAVFLLAGLGPQARKHPEIYISVTGCECGVRVGLKGPGQLSKGSMQPIYMAMLAAGQKLLFSI